MMKTVVKIMTHAIWVLALFVPVAMAEENACPDNQLKMPDGSCFSEQIERAKRSRVLTALVEYFRENPDEIRRLFLLEGTVVLRGIKLPYSAEEVQLDLAPSVSGVLAAAVLQWGWGAVAIALILALSKILVAIRFLATGQGYPYPRLQVPNPPKPDTDAK